MEPMTWTTVDKSGWGDGPWQSEPDKEQFTDEATGLPCLIKRGPVGALCGYVGVAEGHPWFGVMYQDLDADVNVHGSLTFSDFCHEGPEDETICHVPGPGEPDRVWWLGFDCAHAWDLAPAMRAEMASLGIPGIDADETYRPIGYVKAECATLAAQAAAVSTEGTKA